MSEIKLKEPQFYELKELAEAWNCSLDRIWKYLQYRDLPVCVDNTSVYRSLKASTHHGPTSVDSDLISSIMLRHNLAPILGALHSIRNKIRFHRDLYLADIRCTPIDKHRLPLIGERDILSYDQVIPLPDFLYIDPWYLSESRTKIGTTHPKFTEFTSEGQLYHLVLRISGRLVTGEPIQHAFFLNPDDLNGIGPIGVRLTDKHMFELESKSESFKKEQTSESKIVELYRELKRQKPKLSKTDAAELLVPICKKENIKKRGGGYYSASSIRQFLSKSE